LPGRVRDDDRSAIIVYEQRGIGDSQPVLDCPERDEQALQDASSGVPRPAADPHAVAALLRCRDRLSESRIDLAAYNTTQSAGDVDGIRRALGYDKVDLLAVSYGTLVAQAVMRSFPETLPSSSTRLHSAT